MDMTFPPEMADPSSASELFPPRKPETASERLSRRSQLALASVGALVLVGAALSTVVQISGAVIARGEVAAESRSKSITHPFGGVLQQVLVRDGMRVKAGDVLMRLDANVSQAGATYSSENVISLRAIKARLESEIAGAPSVKFPDDLARSTSADVLAVVGRESQLFQVRRAQQAAQVAMLRDQERQVSAEISGYRQQILANSRQLSLLAPELNGLRGLYKEELVTINRLNEMERANASLIGEAGTLQARVAQAGARIGEIRQQINATQQSARASAGNELNQVVSTLSEGKIRQANAVDGFERTVIRAPQSGIVDAIAYTTTGSAVPAGKELLRIVPDRDAMVVEARVATNDIDQVRVGQPAKVRFSGFNAQTTPSIEGVVNFVSPDRISDERTGMSYYRISISVDSNKFKQQTGNGVTPGMPAEVYITTVSRSFMAYLFKPMIDQIYRTFRDDQ